MFGEVNKQGLFMLIGNGSGQLGLEDVGVCLNSPFQHQLSIGIRKIVCGEEHALYLSCKLFYNCQQKKKDERQLYGVGCNSYGCLGVGNDDESFITHEPVHIQNVSSVIDVSAGWNHSACVLECGSLYTWGRGDSGQLGKGALRNQCEPEMVEVSTQWIGVKMVQCGGRHTMIMRTDNVLMGVGGNESGQCGVGHKNRLLNFSEVQLNDQISKISCGVSHTLLLNKQQQVYSFGSNTLYQLGLGKVIRFAVYPTLIEDLNGVSDIAAGNHSGAVTEEGDLYLWGQGSFGTVDRPLLTSVSDVSKIQIGGTSGIAMDYSGTVYCWGSNTNGELGIGDNEIRSEPYPVVALQGHTIQDIAMGIGYTYALGLSTNLLRGGQRQVTESYVPQNPLQVEMINSEKDYLVKNLKIEQDERMALERINRELKHKIQDLMETQEQLNISIKEKEDKNNLLKERFNDMHQTSTQQAQELMDTRTSSYNLQKQNQELRQHLQQYEQKIYGLEDTLQRKHQESESTQLEVVRMGEDFRLFHQQEQEQLKGFRHQLDDLTLQLSHEKEMREKAQNSLLRERESHGQLQAHFQSYQDHYSNIENRNHVLQTQLENTLVQHAKLSEALSMAQNRIECLQSQNSKLMQDLSILRTSLYPQQKSDSSQPLEVQAVLQLNKELTDVNCQLQGKLKQKDQELIKMKQAYNNLMDRENFSSSSVHQQVTQQSRVSQGKQPLEESRASIINESKQKQQVVVVMEEPNSPIGKTISELLESAHKHAKFMKRILKDIDQEEMRDSFGVQAKSQKESRNHTGVKHQETPSPKRKLQYDNVSWKQTNNNNQNSDESYRYTNNNKQIENEYSKSLSEVKTKLQKLQQNRQNFEQKLQIKN